LIQFKIVLTRYMPKKKEVHLKKLVGAGDDSEKAAEAEVKVSDLWSISNWRNRKTNLSSHIGTQIWQLALYLIINLCSSKECRQY